MKKELETWRQYLTEKERPVQDNYEAHFYLAMTQAKEIDRTELMGSAQTFVGEYKIRFVLTHGADVKYYYDTTLKPGLRKIKGLAIQRDLGYDKTGEE